ncbi:MAG: helix-turn-helix transcriptional regulator, partial [Armatimonadota bacterium]|nr:helix-turn-helix transcriptional regulator [Armatimonadota bacterium]
MTLGARIRELRRARGLTQRALAGDDLSESFISMLEHDKVRPSMGSLRLLADRLGVPLSTLIDDRPRPD